MKQHVLVVSHADADGHVIAEQVRRNLEHVPTFEVSTVVDGQRTKDHKTWLKLDALPEIDANNIVFFVDLMFAPKSFVSEADALVAFASERQDKRFYLIDHHPLPSRLLSQAPNLRALYRRDVVDCTFGTPSWMMVIAALLEKQPTRAKAHASADHRDLAEGIRRAAAPGGPLVGQKLLTLLRFDCWSELIALGRDDPRNHRLPRGRRPRAWKAIGPMLELDNLATKLLRSGKKPGLKERRSVSYDLEIAANVASDVIPTKVSAPRSVPLHGTDLEAIVTLLELAAISLTKSPNVRFSADELYEEACQIGGDEIELDKRDVDIVLDKASFLKKERQKYQLK